jgi:hypothetical protein
MKRFESKTYVLDLFVLFCGKFLSEANSRFACLMTIFAKHRAPDFRLKRNLVVFAAMVADDFKSLWRIVAERGFFRAAFLASLRLHHISLIKYILFLFREKKSFFALYARNFYFRHRFFSFASRSLPKV